ncbi:MAG: hypothetical protein ABGX04_17565 [Myxococcales bacterium]|nr:hypothetical protein [Myxococcales bacterium]
MNQIRWGRSPAKANWANILLPLAVLAFLVLARPALAADALREISWGHADPSSIQSFSIVISPESGAVDFARQVDVGIPAGQLLGSLRLYTAIVSSDGDAFIAVGALDRNGLLSPLSKWSAVQPSQPGQPTL